MGLLAVFLGLTWTLICSTIIRILKNYDKEFRLRQVRQRQEELHEMKEFLFSDSPLRDVLDTTQIFAAGFSYGAATASLEVVTHPKDYKACILLDGWFHIDVGDGIDFPKEVHEEGISIPTLFIGSEHFADIPCFSKATTQLFHDKSISHVIRNSRHQNFCDVGFWAPVWVLRKAGMLGACDYDATYVEILTLTKEFLHSNLKKISN